MKYYGKISDSKDLVTKEWVEEHGGGGGGGEPAAYIKSASVNDRTLTLTKKDNTTVVFNDTGSIVSGIDDGTNWQTITIDGTTKLIPNIDISGKIDNPAEKTSGQYLKYNGTTWSATDLDRFPSSLVYKGIYMPGDTTIYANIQEFKNACFGQDLHWNEPTYPDSTTFNIYSPSTSGPNYFWFNLPNNVPIDIEMVYSWYSPAYYSSNSIGLSGGEGYSYEGGTTQTLTFHSDGTESDTKLSVRSCAMSSVSIKFKHFFIDGVKVLPEDNPMTQPHSVGDCYKLAGDGIVLGKTAKLGDLLICIKDGNVASDDDWMLVSGSEPYVLTSIEADLNYDNEHWSMLTSEQSTAIVPQAAIAASTGQAILFKYDKLVDGVTTTFRVPVNFSTLVDQNGFKNYVGIGIYKVIKSSPSGGLASPPTVYQITFSVSDAGEGGYNGNYEVKSLGESVGTYAIDFDLNTPGSISLSPTEIANVIQQFKSTKDSGKTLLIQNQQNGDQFGRTISVPVSAKTFYWTTPTADTKINTYIGETKYLGISNEAAAVPLKLRFTVTETITYEEYVPVSTVYTAQLVISNDAGGGGTSYTAGDNITISDNTISALKYYKQSEVTGVAGTSTTKLSSTYDVTDSTVTAYYDGMMVTFVLPVAGVTTYGSVFQVNSLGYHPIVYNASAIIGTRYPVGGQITMVYNSVQTATAYLEAGTATTITGCWQIMDYDTSTTDARRVYDYYFRPYSGANAIYRYKICALDKDNRLCPIVITDQTSATQVAKTPNSVALRPDNMWFYASGSTLAAGTKCTDKILASIYYSDNMCQYNFNAAIASYRMIYLRGNYDTTTGLFTLYNDGSSPCTSYYTSVPNKSANINLSSYFTAGYYYWLVGSTYSSTDYLQLFNNHPLYYFDGTNLIPYQEHLVALKQDASTLEADVAAKGFTKNAGTVTSVAAGTGLSVSGTASVNPTVNVASGYKLPTTSEWSGKQDTLTSGLVDVIASGTPASPVEIWVDESEIYGETDYGSIVQSLGTEINKVMSQNAVRVALSDYVRFYPNRIYNQTDVNTYLSDVNNAINNNIYILQMYNVTTMPANLPSGFPNDGSVRYLITIPSEVQGSTQLTQLIFNGNFETIYSRPYYGGSWNAWKTSTSVYGETKTIGASGDFTTLKAGLAYAYANPNTTLILQEGTYNIINEYGGTLSGQGMPIGHGTHLICSPKAKVVCNYTGGDSTIQEIFSVFHAQEGDFTVENLNIETSNIRYCFHDDIGTYSYQGVRNIHRFINCTMSHNNSASPHAARFPQCIGGGLGKDQVIEIVGGCYTTTADTNTNGTISYHNCAEADSRSEIIIKDVYFGGAKGGVRFGWYGNSTLVTKCYVTNCSCTYAPFTRAEVTTAPYENMTLMAWNNEIRS